MSYATVIAALSVVGLVLVIVLALVMKVNCGILGIAFAFILSLFVKDASLLKGFNYALFLNILAVSLLFSIADANGTLILFTKRLVRLIRGNRRLIPFLFFALGFILTAVGSSTISVIAIVCPLCAAVAKEQKMSYQLTAFSALYGTFAGGLSPISATGIIVRQTAATVAIDVGIGLFIRFSIAIFALFLISYIVQGGWKLGNVQTEKKDEKLQAFSGVQWLTLGCIGIFIIGTLVLGYDVTSIGFFCCSILLLCHAADERKAIAGVAWSTLILVGGMGIFIGVIQSAGGIKLMTDTFSLFMNKFTAAPIICLISGLMGFVSSAAGVVIPTLIPTTPALQAAAGVSPMLLVSSICLGSHVIAVSGLCADGAIMMSFCEESDYNRLFRSSLVWTFAGLGLACIAAFTGIIA